MNAQENSSLVDYYTGLSIETVTENLVSMIERKNHYELCKANLRIADFIAYDPINDREMFKIFGSSHPNSFEVEGMDQVKELLSKGLDAKIESLRGIIKDLAGIISSKTADI